MTDLNTIFRRDVEEILSSFDPAPFRGKKILVTGATGLICSLLTRFLAAAGAEVFAQTRNERKAREFFSGTEKISFLEHDPEKPFPEEALPSRLDYIVHGANATDSSFFVSHPAETLFSILRGTENVLNLARTKKCSGMAYISSLEVYGVPSSPEVRETDSGALNPSLPRSSYSEGKRAAEAMCAAYASEFGVPVRTIRLAQTFGAGVRSDDRRVFAQFARAAKAGEKIVLHTRGETERNYCSTLDAVTGILTVLLRGVSGEAYNVANRDTFLSIAEMAERFAAESEGRSKVVFEIDGLEHGYNPPVRIRLMTEKLEKLGWRPRVSFDSMVKRLMNGLV